MALEKIEAVKSIVKSLDALLEEAGFERSEERTEVTSLRESTGETLKGGLEKVYKHKTKDCKFVVNFFLDQEPYLEDFVELNTYLNGGLIKPTNGEYRTELHSSFEEPFGFGWGRENDPITLECSLDVADRWDNKGNLVSIREKTIGYRESKSETGYDIALERLLFSINELVPDKIITAINEAQATLLKTLQKYINVDTLTTSNSNTKEK